MSKKKITIKDYNESSESIILGEMRKYALSLDDDFECPIEYRKYNRKEKQKLGDNPGGRAWLMFFLDKFEKERNGK